MNDPKSGQDGQVSAIGKGNDKIFLAIEIYTIFFCFYFTCVLLFKTMNGY